MVTVARELKAEEIVLRGEERASEAGRNKARYNKLYIHTKHIVYITMKRLCVN